VSGGPAGVGPSGSLLAGAGGSGNGDAGGGGGGGALGTIGASFGTPATGGSSSGTGQGGGGAGDGGAGNASGGDGGVGSSYLGSPLSGGGGGGGNGFAGGGGAAPSGGGGGGGYGAGGGGGTRNGGGGGSSFVTPSATGTPSSALSSRTGNGQVTITYDPTTDACETVPPTVTIATPQDGATYTKGSTVIADYSCADTGGSGLASCVGEVADGAALDTSTLGEHLFTVKAKDIAGNQAASTHLYTVVAAAKPGAPAEVAVGASASGTASVRFTPPLHSGSSPITAYQVNCGGVTKGGMASPITVTGLTNGAPITCKVRAKNAAAGFGPFSEEVAFVPGVPWGPTSVTGGPGPVRGSVVISWNAAQTNGAAITGYWVSCEPRSGSSPPKTVVVGGAKRAAQLNGLTPGQEYNCSMFATNSRGSGNPRNALPTGRILPRS
jgi:hypothetical protein